MKNILFFFCLSIGLASALEKKKDSATTDKLYEYKARFFYSNGCTCPERVISKEVDKDFSPYQYKYQNPVRLDSIADEKKK